MKKVICGSGKQSLKKPSTVGTRFPTKTKKNADAEADKPNGNDIVRSCIKEKKQWLWNGKRRWR